MQHYSQKSASLCKTQQFNKNKQIHSGIMKIKQSKIKILLWLSIISLLLSGCGNETIMPSDIPGSGATRGEALFQLNPLGAAPGCATCHAIEPDTELVGPPMAGIATVAAKQTTGLSTEEYLLQSLIDPDLHLAADFNPGAMPRYGNVLSEADIDDLIEYMMTFE
ncbi:MAG: cytochrome c [Chloroflexi bacterium]|nr:cytochrome c [Chloroflexota bacterium]